MTTTPTLICGTLSEPLLPMPTIPGKVAGIVGVDPVVLQCSDCGRTLTQPKDRGVAMFIVLSGWHFHTCEGRTGQRRCRDCLAVVKSTCDRRHDS